MRNGQDLGAGVLFLAIGLAALWIGADYPMGTPQRPGTGVLPRILSWCLIGTGVALIGKGLFTHGAPIRGIAWRPLIMVTLAACAFARLVDPTGLVVAMLVSMTLCALGTPETRWREYAVFCAIMLAIGVGMFVWLLGMPISVWPTRMPDEIAALVGLVKGGR